MESLVANEPTRGDRVVTNEPTGGSTRDRVVTNEPTGGSTRDRRVANESTGVQALVGNESKGGSGGAKFSITENLHPVENITVWVGDGSGNYSNRKLVKGIDVVWTNHAKHSVGHQKGNKHFFDFHDKEKVTSMDLYTGDKVDRIKFTTNKKTEAGKFRTFEAGGSDTSNGKGGKIHSQELGNGILLGFGGTADSDELVSLGAIFKDESDD